MRTLSVFALTLLAAPAYTQEVITRAPLPPNIRTTGEATVSAQPDRAEIDIGVVTQASTAQAAAAENAKQLDATLKQIRALIGSRGELRTSGYSLTPDYRYPKDGGRPQITGFIARNTIEVRTGDLAVVGKLIDTATEAGANNIQRLQFSLKDEQAARSEALRQAVLKARAGAEAIAAALGVKTGPILAVEEGGVHVIVPARGGVVMEAMRAQAPPTPVEPGTIDVRANVALTVAIAK